jgi:hypothetical protein
MRLNRLQESSHRSGTFRAAEENKAGNHILKHKYSATLHEKTDCFSLGSFIDVIIAQTIIIVTTGWMTT